MFHLVRLNTALAVMISAILQWISETQSIRDDRNMNELFSMLKQVGSRKNIVLFNPKMVLYIGNVLLNMHNN